MANPSVLIRVPATVGNFGGAANCAALALDAPLNVKVTPRLDGHAGIRYFGVNGERVPRDRSNLVVRAMEAALHLKQLEFTGADFEIYSSVPVGVGLGSSSAAVLAGLLAADRLFRLRLDEKTLFDLAAIYESRQDNLRAAWLGGFVACAEDGEGRSLQRTVVPENFVLHVVTPEARLGAREEPSRKQPRAGDAQAHAGRARALAEFFRRAGDGKALRLEEPLPPTVEKSVPGLKEALHVRVEGTLAVFACGSGPAVGVLAQGDDARTIECVRKCFEKKGLAVSVDEYRPTNAGARDWNALQPDISLPPLRGLGASLHKSSLSQV
jgi:homoserine kinase